MLSISRTCSNVTSLRPSFTPHSKLPILVTLLNILNNLKQYYSPLLCTFPFSTSNILLIYSTVCPSWLEYSMKENVLPVCPFSIFPRTWHRRYIQQIFATRTECRVREIGQWVGSLAGHAQGHSLSPNTTQEVLWCWRKYWSCDSSPSLSKWRSMAFTPEVPNSQIQFPTPHKPEQSSASGRGGEGKDI